MWRRCYQATGIDLDGLVTSLSNFDTIVTPESREKMFLFLARYMDKYLTSQREGKSQSCGTRIRFFFSRYLFIFCSHKYGNILSAVYLIIKFFYCANIGDASLRIYSSQSIPSKMSPPPPPTCKILLVKFCSRYPNVTKIGMRTN